MKHTEPRSENKWTLLFALAIWPIASLLLIVLGYTFLSTRLPDHIVRHVGPDGDGYGSTFLFILGATVIAFFLLLIGGLLTNGYIQRGHLYGTEKMLSVSIISGGFGVVAIGLCILLANLDVFRDDLSDQGIGLSLLGFVVVFSVSAAIYAKVLPKARIESAAKH